MTYGTVKSINGGVISLEADPVEGPVLPPKVEAPSVGEMAAVMRRRPASKALLELESGDLLALSKSEVDDETRMLAEVLAVMSPGQRKLLAWKAR